LTILIKTKTRSGILTFGLGNVLRTRRSQLTKSIATTGTIVVIISLAVILPSAIAIVAKQQLFPRDKRLLKTNQCWSLIDVQDRATIRNNAISGYCGHGATALKLFRIL
jgi:hypothetical protein